MGVVADAVGALGTPVWVVTWAVLLTWLLVVLPALAAVVRFYLMYRSWEKDNYRLTVDFWHPHDARGLLPGGHDLVVHGGLRPGPVRGSYVAAVEPLRSEAPGCERGEAGGRPETVLIMGDGGGDVVQALAQPAPAGLERCTHTCLSLWPRSRVSDVYAVLDEGTAGDLQVRRWARYPPDLMSSSRWSLLGLLLGLVSIAAVLVVLEVQGWVGGVLVGLVVPGLTCGLGYRGLRVIDERRRPHRAADLTVPDLVLRPMERIEREELLVRVVWRRLAAEGQQIEGVELVAVPEELPEELPEVLPEAPPEGLPEQESAVVTLDVAQALMLEHERGRLELLRVDMVVDGRIQTSVVAGATPWEAMQSTAGWAHRRAEIEHHRHEIYVLRRTMERQERMYSAARIDDVVRHADAQERLHQAYADRATTVADVRAQALETVDLREVERRLGQGEERGSGDVRT